MAVDNSDCDIIAALEIDNIPSKNLLVKLGFIYNGLVDDLQSEVYIYPNE